MLKRLTKKLIPSQLLYLRHGIPNYFYDLKKFGRYSMASGLNSEINLISEIIREYHIIEKGLTMPESRSGFGKKMLIELINNIIHYVNNYSLDNEQLKHAIGVVYEYEKFHADRDFKLDEDVIVKIHQLRINAPDVANVDQVLMSKENYFEKFADPFSSFSWSRSSLRNYTEEDLDINILKKCVEIARNTPSVCNRQAARVYVFTDKEQIRNILEVQGGNRGFGHLANKLIVITAELGVFIGWPERNQAYMDGGMFAMNLLYTLHANKIAACILNCSHTNIKDKKMREVCPIKDSEVFIAMITCGHAPDEFKIALSPRYSIDRILTIIK